ncbi:28980_t:CDS:2, partial [Racocetra persica]
LSGFRGIEIVRQYIQSCVNKQHFINQGVGTKGRKNVIYYDSGYQNDDRESKSYSFSETLHDEENAELAGEEIRRRDVSIQANDLINALGKREAILLNRLLYKEEKKELRENLKLRDKFNLETLQKYSLESPKIHNLPVAKKYLSLFTKNHKFIEISRIIEKSENTARQLKLKTVITAVVNFNIGVNTKNALFSREKTLSEQVIKAIEKEESEEITKARVREIINSQADETDKRQKETKENAIGEIQGEGSLSKEKVKEIIENASVSGRRVFDSSQNNFEFSFNFF